MFTRKEGAVLTPARIRRVGVCWGVCTSIALLISACTEKPTGLEMPPQALQSSPPNDYVTTPAGWYHRSCVHEIENGAHVDKRRRVRRRDGTTYQIPNCLYPARIARPGAEARSPTNNGWIEYASTSQPFGSWYQQLTASWTVPAVPVASYSGTQVYFTFPGLQSNAFIIQPVIQYGRSAAGGGPFWAMASWHCDDGSNCIHSPLTTISAGDAMSGSVVASDCANGDCTWTITTRDVTTGQRTILAVADTQNYWWSAGGAVEVYGLTFCAQYPINGVFYSGISLYDRNLNQVSPSWFPYIQPGTDPSCSFNVTSTGTSVNLYHNLATVTASGGLTAGGCFMTNCYPRITSVTASGNAITLKDQNGNTGTITLSGAAASGGLTAGGCFMTNCYPRITSFTASGNAITLKDQNGQTGTITLSGATASGGLTAGGCLMTNCYPRITSVTAQSNTIILKDQNGNNGYMMLSQ